MAIKWRKYLGTTNSIETEVSDANPLPVSINEFIADISSNNNKQLNISPYLVDEFGVFSHMLGDNQFAGAPVVVDSAHHEIHCGDSYIASRVVDLAGSASDIIIINIPNETGNPPAKQYHFVLTVITESECQFDIYEGATTVSDGTPITAYNRNRNSANTTACTLYHTPNTPAGGTLINSCHWGGGKNNGGEQRSEQELILKNNTKYRLVLTNAVATANHICWEINHYVHPGI